MLSEEILNQLAYGAFSTWQGTPTPWTHDDMKVYYAACQLSPEMMFLIESRCAMHRAGQFVTPFDDLQLQRDALTVKKNYGVLYLFEQLRRQLPATQLKKMLFKLLSIYQEHLRVAEPEDDVCGVLIRIDMINRHFAFKIMQAIERKQSDFTEFRATLRSLGALKHEVFPCLSVKLRESMLIDALPFGDAKNMVHATIAFYKMVGCDQFDVLKKIMIGYNSEWDMLNYKGSTQQTLNKWMTYLKKQVLSPLMVTRMHEILTSMMLKASFKHQKRAAFVLEVLAVRVQQAPYLLASYRKLFTMKGFLPISANLFYGMLDADHEGVIELIQDYAETVPDILNKIMLLIFSDEAYTERHKQLLGAGVHGALTTGQYPLFMFRKHNKPQAGHIFSYGTSRMKTTFEIEENVHGHGDDVVQPTYTGMWCDF